MPLFPADQIVLEDALDGQGVPSTMNEAIFAAIDGAGFLLQPAEGSPASVLTAKTGAAYRVDGLPNAFIKTVDMGGGTVLHWLEVTEGNAVTQRISLTGLASASWDDIAGTPTTLAGYGITDAAAISHTHAWADLTSKPTSLVGLGVATTEPIGCDMRRRRLSMYANRGGSTRTNVGAGAATPAGTLGGTTDFAGGFFQSWTTTAVTDNVAGGSVFTSGLSGSDVQMRWLPAIFIKFRLPTDITSTRYFAGLTSASIGTADSPSTWSGVVIRASTSASDANWKVLSGDNSTVTTVDSGVAIAADTNYCLAIVATATNSVDVYLGTTEATMAKVATVTATLPASGTSLFTWLSVTTLSAATRVIWYSRTEVSHT